MPAPDPKRALHWDGTITAGNVLTAITLLPAILSLIVWAVRLEGRVDDTKARQDRLEAAVSAGRTEDRAANRLAFDTLREGLVRIENILLGNPPNQPRRQ